MRKIIASIIIFFLCTSISSGQLNFALQLDTAPVTVMPPLHSCAFANHNGNWFFIGGRTNGLHGFQVQNGFPSSGINDSIYIIDPVNNIRWAQSTSGYDTVLKEMLQSAFYEYTQRDSMLYIVGGYGFNDSAMDYFTQPRLLAVNLNLLQSALIAQSNAAPLFRMITDSFFAVTGGNMYVQDSTFYIVFGHKFDGHYSENDSAGFFTQRYTNSIRSFVLHDDGANLSVSAMTELIDSANFHRRDFNLVPQKFPDGTLGHTAFTGVFRYEARLPFLDCVNIYSNNTYEVIPNFNQNLNQYSTASMPVYDVQNNIMQTVFFGGTALYTYDTITHQLIEDTLVPFVNTISKVARMADSSMTEYVLPVTMPALMGTNAIFINHPQTPLVDNIFVDINNVNPNIPVGYIVGGIWSPLPNISQTGVTVSSAVSTVLRVWLQPVATGVASTAVKDNIFNLLCFPNPAREQVVIVFDTKFSGNVVVNIVDGAGQLADKLFEGNIESGHHQYLYSTKNLQAHHLYFVKVIFGDQTKTYKIITH